MYNRSAGFDPEDPELDSDLYDEYAEEYDPDYQSDMKRLRRPPDPHFVPKVPHHERPWARIEQEKRRSITGDFDTTYTPGHVERQWLMGLLRPFFEAEYLDDVLGKVKGGKEADVYRCSLTEGRQRRIFAAKLYRPRSHRTMSNDLIYREGRRVLGQPHTQTFRANDQRVLRAMLKRTDYGKQAQQTSWLMHEYHALEELHRAGADVPMPVESAPNAILMEFIGDEQRAAPVLHDVQLDAALVKPLFDRVVHNMKTMLEAGFIHGDLSAHNILFWNDSIVLIDFPQVVPVTENRQAYALLERDVRRICQYWARQGLQNDPEALARSLWGSYSSVRHEDVLADLSALLAKEDEDWDESDSEYDDPV